MGVLAVLILAIIQGAAELLPVSSSAHVIVAGQLLGYDVGSPAFIFVLVMLHTGTMGAVIIYFYSRWKALLTGSPEQRNQFIGHVALASAITAAVALVIIKGIEKTILGGGPDAHFETLGRNPKVVAAALFAAGILILASTVLETRIVKKLALTHSGSFIIGFMQGLCLPFRGFSRSGATISSGLILGMPRQLAEEFSFALAVVLTPAAIGYSVLRLMKEAHEKGGPVLDLSLFYPGLGGMVLSFVSGWLALKLLSNWIEKGRWAYFGYYCIAFAGVVLAVPYLK